MRGLDNEETKNYFACAEHLGGAVGVVLRFFPVSVASYLPTECV